MNFPLLACLFSSLEGLHKVKKVVLGNDLEFRPVKRAENILPF